MKIFHKILLVTVFVLLPAAVGVAQGGPEPLDIYFFYGRSCPHCHAQMPLMKALAENNDDIVVHFYEVSQAVDVWREFLERHQIKYRGFPRTFVGDKSFIGYSPTAVVLEYSDVLEGYLGNRVQIVKAVERQLGHRVSLGSLLQAGELPGPGAVSFWPLLLPIVYGLSYFLLRPWLARENRKRLWQGGFAASAIIAFFLFLGLLPDETVKAYAQRLPYPLFVFVIALADGFNPCAFTVLVILLSLLTYTKRRKDMLVLGFTFIATSAVMYFIFIMLMVLIGGFFIERYGRIITLLLGAAVTGAGVLNIKDFFFLNKGISLSLTGEQKLRFTKKAGTIVRELGKSGGKFYLAVGGTIMLGIVVNLVELGCTAILPAVYLTTLVSRYDSYTMYSAWTSFYAIVYVLPLLAILGNFIYVFKSERVSEQQGRLLKLIAGTVMLLFGLLMIFKPEMLAFS
jgi:thiol-disulfide isomerase/thioredoxin